MRKVQARTTRIVSSVLVGVAYAFAELLFTLLTGLCLVPVLGSPRGKRAVLDRARALAVTLAGRQCVRLARSAPELLASAYTPDRALRYVAVRWTAGMLGGLVLGTLLLGALYASSALWMWAVTEIDAPWTVFFSSLGGLFLVFLGVHGLHGVAALDMRLARHHLGPSEQTLLERRIAELASTRAGVLDAVHDERRRIERYLHDGMQQQLVALGMLLARAQRSGDPARSAELVGQAHEVARRTLDELRDVAWRVYPAALDESGLHAALETVAERSVLPVRLRVSLGREPPDTVRTVAYFVVSEAVTNAAKHARATRAEVRVGLRRGVLSVRVKDDGHGGADPEGSGLLGLARRVAALDGRLWVDSPRGGPTVLTAELPCD
ncbi:sensor histidine kinase [Streptomyces armeniacus]|uniref:histidine kinase n=1 Tax=Streptomyces armeniacus TaxID=83291 RepID=A0A345XI32_9ACTN|nr:histidine kinase [Streptomyces armeniacus]AXK31298.1 sensor histidine kinase [Streptomyces armeniacus]